MKEGLNDKSMLTVFKSCYPDSRSIIALIDDSEARVGLISERAATVEPIAVV